MTRKLWEYTRAWPVSDTFNPLSAPTLIFYSWKWTSGLIVFWINRAASLSVHDAPLSYLFLQFLCLPVSLSHWYVHTFIKNWPMYITCLCKSDNSLTQAYSACHPWQVAPRHDYSARPWWMWKHCRGPSTKNAPFWMKLFSFLLQTVFKGIVWHFQNTLTGFLEKS